MHTSARTVIWLLAWCGAAACTGHVYRDLEPVLDQYEAQQQADVRSWYLRASVAEQRGDGDEADDAWRWVLRLEDSGWTRLGHGAYLERQGRWDEAIDAYQHAAAHDPSLSAAYLGIGRVRIGRGDDEGAVAPLREAGPTPEALHLLGRLYLRRGDTEAAAEVYETWAALDVTTPDSRLGRARLAAATGHHGAAVDDLVVALESHDASPVTGSLLIDEARRSCRIGTAWRWARERGIAYRSDPGWRAVAVEIGLAARDPDMVEAASQGFDLLAERMELLDAAGRSDEALALARQAQEARPDDPEPALRAGRLLAGHGRHADALAAWEDVTSMPVDRAASLLALGRLDDADAVLEGVEGSKAAWLRGRVQVARGDLTAAEAEVRDLPERWRLVASLRREAGDLDGAMDAMARAERSARTLRDTAMWAEEAGRAEAALDAWRALAAQDPGDDEAWLGIARLDPDGAGDAVEQALAADPCSVPALLARAGSEEACDAIGPLERAAQAAPLDADVRSRLRDAYDGCGRTEGTRWHP